MKAKKCEIIYLIKKCKELTNELNDELLNLLDSLGENHESEDLEELSEFCNGLTKWSTFNDIEYLVENLLKENGECDE